MVLDPLERLWDNLLSRQPDQIRLVFSGLTVDEQQAIRTHLLRMVEEPGWHPEQRISARAALDAIAGIDGKTALPKDGSQ